MQHFTLYLLKGVVVVTEGIIHFAIWETVIFSIVLSWSCAKGAHTPLIVFKETY